MLPETTAHPVADVPLTIAYPETGKDAGYAVLHKTGCSHANRRASWGREARDLPAGWHTLADDWFEVAPCARAKKGS